MNLADLAASRFAIRCAKYSSIILKGFSMLYTINNKEGARCRESPDTQNGGAVYVACSERRNRTVDTYIILHGEKYVK